MAIWKSYKSISFVLLLLLTFVNIIFSSIGQGATLVDRGDNTYGGKWVINPSGGLISKGHPLGATGNTTYRFHTFLNHFFLKCERISLSFE